MTATMLPCELAAVRVELNRVDSKCSILAGLAGAGMLALVAQLTTHRAVHDPAWWVAAVSALTLAASVVQLLAVLRPRLGSTGFRAYATMTADQLIDDLSYVNEMKRTLIEAEDLRVLSAIVNRKYLALRRAVDLAVAAVVFVGAALLVGVVA